MRLSLPPESADLLHTEEGEPQPVSSCRADGRGSRSLARRLFLCPFSVRPAPGATRFVHSVHRIHRRSTSRAASRILARAAHPHPQYHPPPEEPQKRVAGPAEPHCGPGFCSGGDPFEAETKKPRRVRGFQSGRRDSNSGPLVPQTSALTRLRHAPRRDHDTNPASSARLRCSARTGRRRSPARRAPRRAPAGRGPR